MHVTCILSTIFFFHFLTAYTLVHFNLLAHLSLFITKLSACTLSLICAWFFYLHNLVPVKSLKRKSSRSITVVRLVQRAHYARMRSSAANSAWARRRSSCLHARMPGEQTKHANSVTIKAQRFAIGWRVFESSATLLLSPFKCWKGSLNRLEGWPHGRKRPAGAT